MNYTKPQIVAKSATKKSYVAGCPANKYNGVRIRGKPTPSCVKCEISGS